MAGYRVYIDLIKDLLHGKQVISNGMGQEVERARAALQLAAAGRKVALVSSGDSGIYGMAGLIGEILREQPDLPVQVEVVPGIPLLAACAALLAAPLPAISPLSASAII